jgi:hypothetical protein
MLSELTGMSVALTANAPHPGIAWFGRTRADGVGPDYAFPGYHLVGSSRMLKVLAPMGASDARRDRRRWPSL